MIVFDRKSFHSLFFFFVLMCSSLFAQTININAKEPVSILHASDVYFDFNETNLSEIRVRNLFAPYIKDYINTGMQRTYIWIRFRLYNESNATSHKILILTSPLLESITFYKQSDLKNPEYRGVNYIDEKEHRTLLPYYHIYLPAQSLETYYLQVSSFFTPVDFALRLDDYEHFKRSDKNRQILNSLLIGFVSALMLYSFLLYFYTKDKSYLYYSLYLFALIYQQSTYLGLTQIFFPLEFIHFDMQIPVLKVNLLVITAALFAMHFLKTKALGTINTIYKIFIAIALIEILILSIPRYYNLYIVIFTGGAFILFNLVAGIVAYIQGNKQARLFIVGFGIVFISYLLIILDSIGVTSIIQEYRNILIVATAFEALILSLAFADRYLILQKEKARVDARILEESTQRTKIIEQEVVKKTKELNKALQTKELLLKEVHHRVKNNLQIILSIIRLQKNEIEDEKTIEKFIDLENRINAISKTYNMLLIKEDIEKIDMAEYIDSLLLDIQETLQKEPQKIRLKTDIDAQMPLREAVYVGLIVNELVTNAFKYAFEKEGSIFISLKQNVRTYVLKIEDSGKGYDAEKTTKSLGLKLIHTLVYNQLGGTLKQETQHHTRYIIRFTL